MENVKLLKKGDKVILKKFEEIAKELGIDCDDCKNCDKVCNQKKEYEKFVGKTLTVKQILKVEDDGSQQFEVEEDNDYSSFSSVITAVTRNFDTMPTKESVINSHCVKEIVSSAKTETKAKNNIAREMSDFIGFLNKHNINGTALYQEFKKEVKHSE